MSELSVLHVVASVNPNTGGPARTVPGLAGALARLGINSTIVSLDYTEFGAPVIVDGVRNIALPISALGRRLRGWSPKLNAAIAAATAHGVDVIHNHGVWMYPGVYARRVAKRSRIPLMISPRGMLDSWSLDRHKMKKTVASLLYENRNLASADVLHATSKMEANSIRRFGLEQPIAVVANGVDLPDTNNLVGRMPLDAQFPKLRGRRCVLYMGRLDPKKGIDMLLDAWRPLHRHFPNWHLLVAGPDLANMRPTLESAIRGSGTLEQSMTFGDMLVGTLKESALRSAELFILPTRSENFGVAVAEALAHGTPVITTTAAPWVEIVEAGCGWCVEPQRGPIRAALETAMGHSADQLAEMGRRGRQLVASRYSWQFVAEHMRDVYQWVLGRGAAPECVV